MFHAIRSLDLLVVLLLVVIPSSDSLSLLRITSEARTAAGQQSSWHQAWEERGGHGFWPIDGIFGRPEKEMYSDRQRLAPENAHALYQCVHSVARIFEARNITYWAGSGTLLGAARNQGIIPHDDDIDLQILVEDVDKLLGPEVAADLARNDMKLVHKYRGLWGITNASLTAEPLRYGVPLPEWMVRSEEPPYPYFVDIFSMKLHNDELRYVNGNGVYKSRFFFPNVTENLVKWPFGNSSLYAPIKEITEPYLDGVYGSDWKTAVSCAGTLHGCKTADDKMWALTHMAEPSGPIFDPTLDDVSDASAAVPELKGSRVGGQKSHGHKGKHVDKSSI